jgi:hypothetical protein
MIQGKKVLDRIHRIHMFFISAYPEEKEILHNPVNPVG